MAVLVSVLAAALVVPAAAGTDTLFPERTVTLSAEGSNPASGILHLRNDSDQERPISLTASDFVSQTTKKGLNAKTVFFGPTDTSGHIILDTKLLKGARLAVRIEVSNVWEAGESVATLYNQGDAIGTIKIVRFRPPFNVKLMAGPGDKPELAFFKGEPQQLPLRNDDGMTYTVQVTVAVAGQPQEPQSLTLGPNSSGVVTIPPLDGWFTAAGLLRDEFSDGTVTLAYRPEGATADPGWPQKVIPFKARLSRLPAFWLDLLGYIFIFLLLLLGGICSMLLGNWFPNQQARARVKARLTQLADRIRGLASNRIGSKLQVSLRVARQRMCADLYSRWSISAELPTVLAAVSQRADALEKVLGLVEAIDGLFGELAQRYKDGGPAKQLEAIEARLRNAMELLSRIEPPQADVQATQGLIDEAKAALEKIGQPDAAFGKDLADRAQSLQGMQAKDKSWKNDPPSEVFPEVHKVSPELANILVELFRRMDQLGTENPVKPENYGPIDSAITRSELIRDYANLDEKLAADGKSNPARAAAFCALIRVDGPANLRAAKRTIQHMKEGVFPSDIISAVMDTASPPSIVMEPQAARQYSPMYFTIDFPKAAYNACTALEDVRCEWDFHHFDLKEDGWRVWHYFPDATTKDKQKVSVVFTDAATGKRIERGEPVVKEFPVIKEPSQQFGDRNWAELVRLAIALVIALLGLLAGAREQILKLDLIPAAVAVFLLGFGADTIKNLLAPKEK